MTRSKIIGVLAAALSAAIVAGITVAQVVTPLSTFAPRGQMAASDQIPVGAAAAARLQAAYAGDVQNFVTNSVVGYGADPTGEADSYPAFAAAIAALPAIGGQIKVPAGAWKISAAPSWGAKSIYWDISPAATFTGGGAAGFPVMNTNTAQLAVGPWIQCQSGAPAPSGGGIACLNVEFLQPSTFSGFSVGAYIGVRSAAPCATVSCGIWAANLLTTADAGFGGYAHTLELDLNTNSAATAQSIALLLEGIGTYNATDGILIGRADASRWVTGVSIIDAITGIQVINTTGMTTGLAIGSPTTGLAAPLIVTQFANGGRTIIGQRATDTAPTGYFLYLSNFANTLGLFSEDVNGNQTNAGRVTAGAFIAPAVAFSLLDSSPMAGERSAVTNTSVCTFMAAVNGSGGGPAVCPVIWTGSAWVAG